MSETEVFYLWDGNWVRHEDHVEEVERLKAEIKRLKAERDEAVQDEKRLRVLIDHARQDEARRVSRLRRDEELGCCDTSHYGEVSR